MVDGENLLQGGRPWGQGWLNRKLRLRADCGLQWGLPRWEKLPVSRKSSLEGGARAKQVSCIVPSLAPPPQRAPQCSKEGCPALGIPKAPPPYNLTGVPRQRNVAQMKGQSKTPERELSNGEFKVLVIKMLTELIELGQKVKKQVKDTQSEIKQDIQGTTVTGRKLGLKSTIWNKKKK